eukprot:TRINITY_DN668_c0_g1_i2.p1 TRINITY_DN668_c0_g1~~TRINITY_DN668_c0_g1_i2.p1  ORF type:complete len:314 (-),score=90.84 TRINITY_DN668_c0_g1_i2:70-1011(-)
MSSAKKPQDPFVGFSFTGPLRPGVVSPMRSVPIGINRPDYADSGIPKSEEEGRSSAIEVKSPEDIQKMRDAGRVAREVLDVASRCVRPGITTDEIDRIVHEACIERGAYPSPLNYRNFPKSVCTSVNEVICHGIPDSRELIDGDIVNLDVTTYFQGFHGDLNETIPVGNINEESKKLIKTTYECLEKAIAIVRPGTAYSEIGDVIEKYIKANGLSVVRAYTGHGIGRLFHTVPTVLHYGHNRAAGIMKAGHTFTIEPMINVGRSDAVHWPDDWTAVTADGSLSAQFEHTILVTEDGAEVLTRRTENSYKYWWM